MKITLPVTKHINKQITMKSQGRKQAVAERPIYRLIILLECLISKNKKNYKTYKETQKYGI